jgi:hypothetical protein
MTGHPYIECLDAPGKAERRWECQACKRIGTLAWLRVNPCNAPCTVDTLVSAIDGPSNGARRD